MTQSDYGRVGGMVVKQYRYLQRFAEQIEAGLPLDGRFVRRAKMYAESGRSTYHAALRAEMIVRRKSEERSRLAPADHCPECVDEHNKGWGRIGHIKLIGTRECRSNCKCFAEYR